MGFPFAWNMLRAFRTYARAVDIIVDAHYKFEHETVPLNVHCQGCRHDPDQRYSALTISYSLPKASWTWLEGDEMTSRIDIRIDITDANSESPLQTAAWVYLPDGGVRADCTIVFAFPGATYSRSYYDLQVQGRTGYSFAEHLAKAGHIVVACDHIGIGHSSAYEPFAELTRDVVIRADNATVQGVMNRLREGTLVDELAPVANSFKVGVGHSMGGFLLVLQQDQHRSFDAVVLLGCTHRLSRSKALLGRVALSYLKRKMPDPTRPPRELFHSFFHDENVPDDVKMVDDALAVRVYSWAFEKPDIRRIMRDVHRAACRIDVPVFLGFGARDSASDPRSEVGVFASSTDLTTFVLPESAHCFNFAKTRTLFFDRLSGWIRSVSKTYRDVTDGQAGSVLVGKSLDID